MCNIVSMLNDCGDAQSMDLTNGEMLPTMLMGQKLTVMLAKGVMIMGEASNGTVTMPNIAASKASSIGLWTRDSEVLLTAFSVCIMLACTLSSSSRLAFTPFCTRQESADYLSRLIAVCAPTRWGLLDIMYAYSVSLHPRHNH